MGVELVLCSTCLDRFGLTDQVAVGVIGGMGDIITAITQADNAITFEARAPERNQHEVFRRSKQLLNILRTIIGSSAGSP